MTRSVVLLLAACASGGCAALTNPVADGVPVNRLPPEVFVRPKAELQTIPLTLLRRPEPAQYTLDRGDVLAVIAGDLFGPENQPPPAKVSDQFGGEPAVGYPVPVRDDGTISLPIGKIRPILVRGKTLSEVEELIRRAIVEEVKLFKPEAARVSVQLYQKRRIRVEVVREDTQPLAPLVGSSTGQAVIGTTRKGTGAIVPLEYGQNDVLHALNLTGGLPGLDAKNEVIIYRGGRVYCDPAAQVVRIPLRIYPDQPLTIREEDITLQDGDVVRIEARDTEVYYTAGILGGGQFLLPRDYDLDVVQAIAQVRGPLVNGSFSQNAFVAQAVNNGIGFPNPSLLAVLRKLSDGRQINIRVDLNKALRDPRERILIKAGDVIVLQERPGEAIGRYISQRFLITTTVESIQSRNIQQTLVGTNP